MRLRGPLPEWTYPPLAANIRRLHWQLSGISLIAGAAQNFTKVTGLGVDAAVYLMGEMRMCLGVLLALVIESGLEHSSIVFGWKIE